MYIFGKTKSLPKVILQLLTFRFFVGSDYVHTQTDRSSVTNLPFLGACAMGTDVWMGRCRKWKEISMVDEL